MFGLIRPNVSWDWALFGKHPVEGDFLSAGTLNPILKGFSGWIDKGYFLLPVDKKERADLLWRFWARGPNGKLVCGIIKTSRDSHGRVYPLLIIGSGKAAELLKHWDLIPIACQKTWLMLEQISAKPLGSVKAIRRELSAMIPPVTDIRSLEDEREVLKAMELRVQRNGRASDYMNKLNNVEGLSRREMFTVRLDVGDASELPEPVVKMMSLIKARSPRGPEIVFTGGARGLDTLIWIKRTFTPDDFQLLWEDRN